MLKYSIDYMKLKKSQASDDVVGQITRYMGWIKKESS
jgi:hypothetical protein